jgi:hypothetical protein
MSDREVNGRGAKGRPDQKRFAFQLRAAAIQREASGLVLAVSELFTVIFATRRWPEERTDEARLWSERGSQLAGEWRRLDPPRVLEPLWRERESQFRGLAELIAAVPEARELSGSDLVDRVRELQIGFNRQLETLNETQSRLLDEERALQRLSGAEDRD